MTRNRRWTEVKKDLEEIRTNVTGVNWRDAEQARVELTTAQKCRREQDCNDPRRIYFCGRCGHATGSYQGHYWKWCRKRPETLGNIARGEANDVEFHVCCPDSCALDDPDPNPVQPCHPAPDQREQWVKDKVAERENYEKWRTILNERGHL